MVCHPPSGHASKVSVPSWLLEQVSTQKMSYTYAYMLGQQLDWMWILADAIAKSIAENGEVDFTLAELNNSLSEAGLTTDGQAISAVALLRSQIRRIERRWQGYKTQPMMSEQVDQRAFQGMTEYQVQALFENADAATMRPGTREGTYRRIMRGKADMLKHVLFYVTDSMNDHRTMDLTLAELNNFLHGEKIIANEDARSAITFLSELISQKLHDSENGTQKTSEEIDECRRLLHAMTDNGALALFNDGTITNVRPAWDIETCVKYNRTSSQSSYETSQRAAPQTDARRAHSTSAPDEVSLVTTGTFQDILYALWRKALSELIG